MNSLEELISTLKKFPGLGLKSAKRIAYYLLKQDNDYLKNLGGLISNLKDGFYICSQCGNISKSDPCEICSDPMRDRKTLCIVEDFESLSAFETAGIYNGLYHVLGKKVPSANGYDLTDEAIDSLVKHVKKLKPDEIIIATSPKIEGDMAYYTLTDILKNAKVKRLSRIALGLPIGSSIEFADRVTLHAALESRSQVK